MKNLLLLLLIFTGLSLKAQETYSVSGTVNDEKGQPIPGATVFITNTKNVTVTDGSGKFILPGLSAGPYEVVVKMLGFTPDIQALTIINKSVVLNIKLKEANTLLHAVTIKGRIDKTRKWYMEVFTENFIGKSPDAAQCKILNPDSITFFFNHGTGVLNAYANDFLVIQNDALGYRIKYLLKKFESISDYGPCVYEGSPYFEELSGDEEQKKLWEKNRQAAYLGSNRHFFRAVMNNTAASEGFALCQESNNVIINKDFDSVFTTINNTKTLISKVPFRYKNKPRDEYYIVYKRAKESGLFNKTGFPVSLDIDSAMFYQFSRIRTFADTIKINKELLLNPAIDLSFAGYWAWERIAEYLPLDYVPGILTEKK